jgi:hypothetical protein
MNEEFDSYLNKLDHLKNLSESFNNIVDIVGKDTLGISNAAMREMQQAQIENANAALAVAKSQMEANETAHAQVLSQYEAAGGDANADNPFKEALKEAESALQESQTEFMSRWETALTAAADAFKSHVEMIAEEFSESMGGIYGTLEEMQTAFDRQKQIGELYFQNYKKVYEVSKLNRQISKDIAKTDNVKAQRELSKLAAEVNAYNKDDMKMSEYDLGYLQKKYELLQA